MEKIVKDRKVVQGVKIFRSTKFLNLFVMRLKSISLQVDVGAVKINYLWTILKRQKVFVYLIYVSPEKQTSVLSNKKLSHGDL